MGGYNTSGHAGNPHTLYVHMFMHTRTYVYIHNATILVLVHGTNLPTNATRVCENQHNFKVRHLSLVPLCIQPPFTADEVRSYVNLLGNFSTHPRNSQLVYALVCLNVIGSSW